MGAASFVEIGVGKTPEEAFQDARSRALWENGHRGYTGSIAEKHSFVRIKPPATVATLAEVEEFAGSLLDGDDPRIGDKWGPAGCIDLGCVGSAFNFLFFGWASS